MKEISSPAAVAAPGLTTTCPVCGNLSFHATDEQIDISRLMKRWTEHGVSFKAETLDRYRTETIGPITLYQCGFCKFGQYRPIIVGDSDFYSAIGNVDYYTETKWEFVRSLELIAKEKPRTVIDLGCGSGLFLDQLRAAMPGIDASGLEINELAASEARSRGHRVDVLDWSSDSFSMEILAKADLIVCHQVLEHVRDPIKFLKTMRELLNEHGLAIISTPNSAGLVGMQIDALTEQPPHHVTKWTHHAFDAALRKVGFIDIRANFEPLPKILWPGYFPTIWKNNSWPAAIGRVAAHIGRFHGEGMNWVADKLEQNGVGNLYGVGGHTILITAKLHAAPPKALAKKNGTGPKWWIDLSEKFAERRRALRVAKRTRDLDQATAAFKASIERFAQQFDTAKMEIDDQRLKEWENGILPSRLTTASLDVLTSILLALNRHHEKKTFLEESDYTCEDTPSNN